MPVRYQDKTPEQKKLAHLRKKEWALRNRDKVIEYKRKHYRENREKYLTIERDRAYRARYGITLAQYDKMLSDQNGCCKICGNDKAGKIGQAFAVDHCHTTNRVRGLLCIKCNSSLGWYERHSEKAKEYLCASI